MGHRCKLKVHRTYGVQIVDPVVEFSAYRKSYQHYQEFSSYVETLLRGAFEEMHLKGRISCRAKEPRSLLRKLLVKTRHDAVGAQKYLDHGLDALDDRVGLRIVTESSIDSAAASLGVQQVFDVDPADIDEKALSGPPDKLKYLGTHLVAVLREVDAAGCPHPPFGNLRFEVQIQTLAESAWATVSHPLVYKPFGPPPSHALASKVYRAVALVSLFDSEVKQAMEMKISSPGYEAVRLLETLEPLFTPWSAGPSDDDLSLIVIDVVKAAYPTIDDGSGMVDVTATRSLLQNFATEYGPQLKAVFELHQDNDHQPFLQQPESLMIAERLRNAKSVLRSCWLEGGLDLEWLENLAVAFGNPYV
jgi:ppGpp synthetase/RelA/SpoT-type nucleotidyltranferase